MAVRSEDQVAGLHIARLGHELVADAVTPVQIRDTVLCRKLVRELVGADIVNLTGRYQVVADNHDLLGVPDLLKAHFLKFCRDEGHHDVVQHHAVRADRHNVAGLYRVPDLCGNQLFNHCHFHLSSVRFSSALL